MTHKNKRMRNFFVIYSFVDYTNIIFAIKKIIVCDCSIVETHGRASLNRAFINRVFINRMFIVRTFIDRASLHLGFHSVRHIFPRVYTRVCDRSPLSGV